MITRRTKVQLLVFVLVTLLGVTYVGARYAQLDRVFYDDAYAVTASLPDSGGIFAGAEVTYRGVKVGQVDRLVLTDEGVDAVMEISNEHDDIPAETLALVGNRSAVGEQYLELQPQVDDGPVLEEGSRIEQSDARLPLPTTTLLENLSALLESVDRDALRTTIFELGTAFEGTGQDLQRIIDTGNSFIETADAEFDTTVDLIRNSNTVLNTQLDSADAIRSFTRDLSLFAGTIADNDRAIRKLIDNGSASVTQVRTFLEQNDVDLGELINNLVTTGEVVVRNLDGIEHILAIYPYVVEGGFTVTAKDPRTGLYDAHFGLILTEAPLCEQGYESTDKRPPQNGENRPMNTEARCEESPAVTNSRGAATSPRPAAPYDVTNLGTWDAETGTVSWGEEPGLRTRGTVAPRTFGEESWKWLFLQPLTQPSS